MTTHTEASDGAISTPAQRDERCPTCGLGWWLNPPVKCDGSNHYRCIECKAIYTGEMVAAPDMLSALQGLVAQLLDYERINNLSPNPGRKYCWDATKRAVAAIAKATQP